MVQGRTLNWIDLAAEAIRLSHRLEVKMTRTDRMAGAKSS